MKVNLIIEAVLSFTLIAHSFFLKKYIVRKKNMFLIYSTSFLAVVCFINYILAFGSYVAGNDIDNSPLGLLITGSVLLTLSLGHGSKKT